MDVSVRLGGGCRKRGTLTTRCVLVLIACLVLTTPAWSGHTLTEPEQKALKSWLAHRAEYRLATDGDCDCAGDIAQMKTGYGGVVKTAPGSHPYVWTGGFQKDGDEVFRVPF